MALPNPAVDKVPTGYKYGWNDPEMTMPKKVGECALISAMNGRMPYAMGCDQNPTQSVCVSQPEQQLMGQWVDAGMPK